MDRVDELAKDILIAMFSSSHYWDIASIKAMDSVNIAYRFAEAFYKRVDEKSEK